MKDLPPGWAWTTLGQVAAPGRPKVSPASVPELPFIGMEHVEAHTMRLLGTVPAGEMKSAAVHFQAGDVLYGRLRPYLNKVLRPSFEGLSSAEFIVFSPSPAIDQQFLQYVLNSRLFVSFASHLNEGDRPRVDFDQIGAFELALPPPPEQRRIVAEIETQISRLDVAIAALGAVETKLALASRSILQKMCQHSDPLATDTCVGDVSECLDRQRIPVNAKERNNRGGSVPYFGANGQVGWIDKALFNELLILVVEDETFVGRTKPFAYRIEGPSWVNNHAHILRPNANVSLRYLHYALMYYPFTPLTTGSTGRRKLTQKALMEAPLCLPDPAEQDRRAESLDRWFSVAEQLSKSVATATHRAARLRQAILKKAFEGKLVPQDPNDEPASVLLERISHSRPGRRRRDVS